jgi:hypothetical protein
MTNMFQHFHDMEFPTNGGLVYAIHYLMDGTTEIAAIPFYSEAHQVSCQGTQRA